MEAKKHILLVDDEIDLTMTLSFILKRKGYTVDTANNGQEAIGKVKERLFDLVLLDIKMPLMNGLEIYKRIKQIKPETVVILMTAYAVEDLIQEALQEGAYGIIYKPLDIENVFALIQEVTEKKHGALVLVIDDDQSSSVKLQNILSKKGFKVASCATGEEAITMAQKKPPYEILFIEMRLPAINGLETYLKIKESNPEIVAIMMTSSSQEIHDIAREILTYGAYACLYKPLDTEKVLQLIEEIVRRRQSSAI